MTPENTPKGTTPHRWTVLLFDDENFTNILDYDSLRDKGFATGEVLGEKQVRKVPQAGYVWLTCEDGYSFDLLACQNLTTARTLLNESEKKRKFDFAFLDWKDRSFAQGEPSPYGNTKGSQSMGFLLGLEVRKAGRDPKCSIVLMSAYSEEANAQFETRWVREILGDEKSGTLDISQNHQVDKTSVFVHPWLVGQERDKAVEKLLSEPESLLPMIQHLSALSEAVAKQPAATIVGFGQQTGQALDLIADQIICAIESDIHQLLRKPIGRFVLTFLFPFRLAPVFRELAVEKSRCRKGERLVLKELDKFIQEIVPLLSAGNVVGRDIVKEVAPVSAKFRDGENTCLGLHPNSENPTHLPTLVTALPKRIEELRSKYTKVIGSDEEIFPVLEQIKNEICANWAAKQLDYQQQCVRVNALKYELLRYNPFEIVLSVFGKASSEAAAPSSKVSKTHFQIVPDYDGAFPKNSLFSPQGFWFWGVHKDVLEAFKTLKGLLASYEPLAISSQHEWFPDAQCLHGVICFRYTKAVTREFLLTLTRGNNDGTAETCGDFAKVLKRLRRYFAVSIGNEHRMLQFPFSQVPETIPSLPTTRLDLHFLFNDGKGDGNAGLLKPNQ